uniref:Myb/SANT-like DNA-binding domain-containing protein 4 n=1 Tax=Acanthochromis polyacanthus TaxID=80966 RepID=A0A3Q1FSC9_9TELE
VKHLKRKRKSNYSVRETQTLIREIHKRRDVLFSRQQNTAINELKRQAWEEVAQGVNALGEGELRTAAEVKRRYLDWRALTKKKHLQAELSLSSSSSSLTMKTEYDQSSPEHEEASLGSGCDQLLDLSGFPKDCHCDWPELVALGEPSGQEGHVPDVYSHNDLGVLSSSKDPTSTTNRDLPLPGGLMGMSAHGLGGLGNHENLGAGFLVAVEKQRLELEKQRLAVETERLAVEKERLLVEKERLRQMEVERERLQLERERLQVERERLRLLLVSQSEHVDSSFNLEKGGKGWMSAANLETEKINLEKERLQLEKERLQFFKFEAGRLQIERERLQVEKERMQLHKDHQSYHLQH